MSPNERHEKICFGFMRSTKVRIIFPDREIQRNAHQFRRVQGFYEAFISVVHHHGFSTFRYKTLMAVAIHGKNQTIYILNKFGTCDE